MNSASYCSHPTMKDVADRAGVSTATVSRALTAPEKVSTPTRLRVEEAAKALGYTHMSVPKHVTNEGTRSVLILVPDISDPFFSPMIRGIGRVAAKNNILITLMDSSFSDIHAENICSKLFQRHFDGIISLGTKAPEGWLEHSRTLPIPFVIANEFTPSLDYPTVHIDNLTASFEAVSYLIEQGMQRIACIAGPENHAVYQYRRQGYIQALRRHNLAIDPHYIARGDGSFQSGMMALQQLMQLPRPPDAIFCHNDKMALGVLYQAKVQRIKIPESLSVIGFDGLEETEFSDPPLTTVYQPRLEIGEAAIELLMELMGHQRGENRSRLMNTTLKLRQSVKMRTE